MSSHVPHHRRPHHPHLVSYDLLVVIACGLAIVPLLLVGLAAPARGAGPPASARDAWRGAAGATAAAHEPGGDDAMVTWSYRLMEHHRHALAIGSDGAMFAVAGHDDGVLAGLEIQRSTDHGVTWPYWGDLYGIDPECTDFTVRIVRGPPDRLFVAYVWTTPGGDRGIRVSGTATTGCGPTWSHATALSQTGVDFRAPSLDADEATHSPYALHLVAEGEDGDGGDVWYTRSTDAGTTWSTPYRVASMVVATRAYREPVVRCGHGGVVHGAWTFVDETRTYDRAIRYRRALNRAANGMSDWQPAFYMTPTADGHDESEPTVAASTAHDWMLVAWASTRPDGYRFGTGLWGNANAGASWDPARVDSLPGVHHLGLRCLPGTGDFVAAGATLDERFGVLRAPGDAPTDWGPLRILTDRTYGDSYAGPLGGAFDSDPSMEQQLAMVWTTLRGGEGRDSLFHDAEWRSGPGWPNLEPGMPVPLIMGVTSPPAICELDGDPESEIVYGDADGWVYALHHDGSWVAGWPRWVFGLAPDAPVAVGDLDGDGRNEVVAGNATGSVYAFRHDGTLMTGWPVTAGAAPAYVSLGPLLSSSPLQVVVTCGTSIRLLRGDGTTVAGWPRTLAGGFAAPAAIGDVDADGVHELVVLAGVDMQVRNLTGAVEYAREIPGGGQEFVNAPTLADLDLDADLEIAAPTRDGRLFVMHHDGTDVAGWPWTDLTGRALTSVALANLLGGPEPELLVATESYSSVTAWCFHRDGTIASGWPRHESLMRSTGAMPVVDPVCDADASVFIWTGFLAAEQHGLAWDRLGNALPGWPHWLRSEVRVSPATGDIDQDGRLEIVFTTYDPPLLIVADLGVPPWRNLLDQPQWWPMYGYNPERMGCLECPPYAVTGAPGAAARPGPVGLDPPRPNPARGAITLRLTLPARAVVRLDVLDVAGRRVCELLRRELEAGVHETAWDGRDATGARAPAGVYFVRLAVPGAAPQVRRTALLP
jgi:hypothetical protein